MPNPAPPRRDAKDEANDGPGYRHWRERKRVEAAERQLAKREQRAANARMDELLASHSWEPATLICARCGRGKEEIVRRGIRCGRVDG